MSNKVQSTARTTTWRDSALLPMKVASEAVGVSITSLYRLADAGRLQLRTLSGRTLVVTTSLIALADSAEDWTPSDRGKEARAKRKEIARAALQS
ncbi:MAG: hypothetical protein K2Z80_37530 [Xanthobacteraceae bacterium]|nr:hypothetical protein [Xanthobacteraceae bacterium]